MPATHSASWRIAFLTTEYALDGVAVGGLGHYLRRMTTGLAERGHAVDVFFLNGSDVPAEVEGVRIIGVQRGDLGWLKRLPNSLRRKWASPSRRDRLKQDDAAAALAEAVAREEKIRGPYDVIQSPDWRGLGRMIPKRRGRLHVCRCSSAADLYEAADLKSGPLTDTRRSLLTQRYALENELAWAGLDTADAIYAPSERVAKHLNETHEYKVDVLRPPAFLEAQPDARRLPELPEKYFVHFGQLMYRKGTKLTLQAFKIARQTHPDLQLVLAGPWRDKMILQSVEIDASRADSDPGMLMPGVHWLGSLAKPQLYSVIQNARAAVLPSLVDNLPNTAIESLLLNVPILTVENTGVDELIDMPMHGQVISEPSKDQLAESMIQLWKTEKTCAAFDWGQSPILRELQPELAINNWANWVERQMNA